MARERTRNQSALRAAWFRVLVACVIVLGCDGSTGEQQAPPDADVHVDISLDVVVALDVGDPLPDLVVSAPDVRVVPDAPSAPDWQCGTFDVFSPTPSIRMSPVEPWCRTSDWLGGYLVVELRWCTSEPLVCGMRVQRGDAEPGEFTFGEEESATEHAFDTNVAPYDFWDGSPEPGTTFRWWARCWREGEEDVEQYLATEPVEITIEQPEIDCFWPYEDACGDGTGLQCRIGLPRCDEGLVPIIVERCHRCVYAETCSCDDGDPAVCASPVPECSGDTELAVQDGCYLCVSPYTCRPLPIWPD